VLTTRRIFNTALELVGTGSVALQDSVQIQLTDITLEAAGETGVHRASTRQDDVVVELGTHINVGLVDDIEEELGNTATISGIDQTGSEESLGGLISLGTDLDDTTIGELKLLHENGGFQSELTLNVQIVTDIAELFLDLTDSLKISSPVESIPSEKEELDQITSDIAASNIKTLGQIREGITFIHRDDMGNTISRVHDNTSQQTLSVQHKHGLDGDVSGKKTVLLEHSFDHLNKFIIRMGREG
jgi:hypothetical protein